MPLKLVDPTGHADGPWAELGGFILGVAYGWAEANLPPTAQTAQAADALTTEESSFATGRAAGNIAAITQGLVEIAVGGGVDAGGGALCLTGVGCVAGAPALVAGTALAAHGALVSVNGVTKAQNSFASILGRKSVEDAIAEKRRTFINIQGRLDDATLEDARDQLSGSGKKWFGSGDSIQHDKAVRDGQNSLQRLIRQIKGALGNRGLTDSQRTAWQSLLDDSQALLDHSKEYVP